MKINVFIVTICITISNIFFCNPVIGVTSSAPEGTITLKGIVMCNTAAEGEAFIKERLIDEHALVFFAITGTKEVDNTVSVLLDTYFPAKGMNTDQAQAVIDGFK